MTLSDLLRSLARRWYVVALGVAVSVGLAYLSTTAPPVYVARTEVVFLAPSSARYPNELVTTTESVIITAGVVAKRINGTQPGLKFGSPFVNPVGAPGDGRQTWIQLLDTGTQWASAFNDQLLVVTTVGATPEEVRQRVDAAAATIDDELNQLQAEAGVDPLNYITTRMSPEQPIITALDGSSIRAAGMTLAVGGLVTLGIVVALEVVSAQRRGRDETRRRARRALPL